MAATIGTVTPETTRQAPGIVTRRELAVLAVALLTVVAAVVLLVLAAGQVASALLGPA